MKSFPKHYLAVMVSAACYSVFANAASADTTLDEKTIEEVVVTASPFSKSAETVNHPVTIMSGKALRNAAAATLGETLNGQLGVSSASFGPGVGMPIIRGQSDNRVKVMQDSVGAMDASAASPDHAITLEPLLASKIEVLRGPAALRYGSGAIGGVVNVLDNRIPSTLPENLEGAAELRNASVNDETVGVANLNAAIGTFAFHLDGIKRDSGDTEIPGFAQRNPPNLATTTPKGFIANTDAEAASGTLGMSYIGDKGFVGVSVNKLDNNYGIPPDSEELVRIDMHQTRYDLKGEINNPVAGVDKISARLGHNDYQHTEVENGENGTVFTNNAYEGRAELIHDPVTFLNMNWKGALGIQAAQSTFAAVGDEAFIPKSDIKNLGIFILEERTQGIWTFELGARIDAQTITPENESTIKHNNLNLSGSTAWHFTDNQKFIISIAQSQRAPSVEELLAHGPHPATGSYLTGTESLNSETSNNIELGYHWHVDEIQISANIFYNHINDFIYAKNLNEIFDDLNHYQYTQADATFKGWEAEVKVPVAKVWSLRFFSDSVRAALDAGEDLPRISPPRIGSSLDYDLDAWSGNLSVTHTAKQNHAGYNESETESYYRVDARMDYTIKNDATDYTLFLKATNLFNAEIRNASSYLRDRSPEAGRSLQVGFRVNF